MDDRPLKTLKEVTAHFNRPAHRIIHLCEAGVVRPIVDAAGRGSVRRFSREDAFRLLLALELQEAGVQAPLIRPLMGALDSLMQLPEVEKLRGYLGPADVVAVIRQVGSQDNPVRAYLTPPRPGRPGHAATPGPQPPRRPGRPPPDRWPLAGPGGVHRGQPDPDCRLPAQHVVCRRG